MGLVFVLQERIKGGMNGTDMLCRQWRNRYCQAAVRMSGHCVHVAGAVFHKHQQCALRRAAAYSELQ
jgi:hypothetical protein